MEVNPAPNSKKTGFSKNLPPSPDIGGGVKKGRLFTYHTLSSKEVKNLEILELILKKKIISRTDISKITGINIASVSNYIKGFIEKRLILEKGYGESSGGRRPELIELDLKDNFIIGIEIGKAGFRAVLTKLDLGIVEEACVPAPKFKRGYRLGVVSLVKEAIRKLVDHG